MSVLLHVLTSIHYTNSYHRLPSGAEYLFVARDEADVVAWVQAINSVIQGGGSAAASSSSSTVSSPPQSVVGSPGHLGTSAEKYLSFFLKGRWN